MSKTRTSRGYTIVEVIMAVAVLALGAAGVIAMQKATLIGNTNARNLATATAIAQSWMERLRVDVQAWNEDTIKPNDRGDTKWIDTALTMGGWVTPDLPTAGGPKLPIGSPKADIMGADVYGADGAATAYCTQYRITRFTSASAATCAANATAAGDNNLCTMYRLLRLEVRVFWDKSVREIPDCTAALPTDYTLGRYGFVYLVSGGLMNLSPYH